MRRGTWDYNNRELFLKVYAWSGAKARVEQAIGASSSHKLGIAINDGGWYASGTSTKSFSTGFGQSVSGIADASIYNSWNYRNYNCYDAGPPYPSEWVERRPENVYDIFNEPYAYAPHVNFTLACVQKSSGTVWKSSGTNVTYSAGVALGPISVSARSGYNTGTKMAFIVTQTSRICGNSSQGWPNAFQVDMRKW